MPPDFAKTKPPHFCGRGATPKPVFTRCGQVWYSQFTLRVGSKPAHSFQRSNTVELPFSESFRRPRMRALASTASAQPAFVEPAFVEPAFVEPRSVEPPLQGPAVPPLGLAAAGQTEGGRFATGSVSPLLPGKPVFSRPVPTRTAPDVPESARNAAELSGPGTRGSLRETHSTGHPPSTPERSTGPLRMVCDSTVALLIAVILLRTFAAEGYLISTGSMAPALLGYHHRVTCPECQQTFAVGTAYDASVEQPVQQNLRATCPNCSLGGIELSDVPINHGDQLLVFKQAYALRSPGRWETAVFRNPSQPTEAFVKRVIALPGEQVQIVDGDVFIGGTRLQKDWPEQRALRILVHDDRHQPQDTRRFRRAWDPVTATGQHALGHTQTTSDTHSTGWQRTGDGFHFQPTAKGQPAATSQPNSQGQTGDSRVAWLAFQRWVRSRPAHPLSIMFAGGVLPASSSRSPEIERLSGVTLDRQRGELSVRGSMPEITRDQLLALSPEPGYHAAVEELYRASHQTGIDDRSSYNAIDLGDEFHPVRDVMLSARVQIGSPGSATSQGVATQSRAQELLLSIGEQPNQALIVFDFAHQELRVSRDRQPLRKQPFIPAETWTTKGVLLEVSLFDQQLRLAVNGADVLGSVPWPDIPAGSVRVLAGTSQVTDSAGIVSQGATLQLGARGLATTVQNLQVWRDVYYTSDRSQRGISQPYTLAANEYFVLGDNSAISHDSRRWTGSGVTSSLLIGKPFVVHLPSRPARLKVGPYEWPVRLPDWDRIRWVY